MAKFSLHRHGPAKAEHYVLRESLIPNRKSLPNHCRFTRVSMLQ